VGSEGSEEVKRRSGEINFFFKNHLVEGTHNRLCWIGALMGIGSFRLYLYITHKSFLCTKPIN
jgi:hypothetical protein